MKTSIVFLLSLVFAVRGGFADELRVTTTADLSNCLSGAALTSGPDAGKAAVANDTCVLSTGSYGAGPFNVTLENLTVRASNVSQGATITGPVTIAARQVTLSGLNLNGGVVVNVPDNITIEDSRIFGAPGPGLQVGGGSAERLRFLNLEVRSNGGSGLLFAGTDVNDVVINNSVFEANAASNVLFANAGNVRTIRVNNSEFNRSVNGSGVEFANGGEVRTVEISSSQLSSNGVSGLLVANGGRAEGIVLFTSTLEANQFDNALFASARSVGDVQIERNLIQNSINGNGVSFANGDAVQDVTLTANTVEQQLAFGAGTGILFANAGSVTGVEARGNRVRNNRNHGLAVIIADRIGSFTFADNQFSQNNCFGVLLNSTTDSISDLQFQGDRFSKNGTVGLEVFAGAREVSQVTLSDVQASESAGIQCPQMNLGVPGIVGTGIEVISQGSDVLNVTASNLAVTSNGGVGYHVEAAQDLNNARIDSGSFVQNGSRAAVGLGSGARLRGGGSVRQVEVNQSTFENNNDHGLNVDAGSDVSNVTVSGGAFNDNDSNVDSVGSGVQISGTRDLSNVSVQDVAASGNHAGIVVRSQGGSSSANAVLIKNNGPVDDNRDAGIWLSAAHDLNNGAVQENTLSNNGIGVHVLINDDGSNVSVLDNRISGPGATGILLDGQGVSVSGNDVSHYDVGLLARRSTGNAVNQNNFAQNDQFGVDGRPLGPGQRLDATSNWWGEPSGPRGAGPGSGDAVSANVDFLPFLTTPAVTTGANFQVSELVVPAQVDPGQSVTIATTVTNVGDAEGTQDVAIRVRDAQGGIVQEQVNTAPLAPAASVDFSLQVTFQTEGTFTVEVITSSDSLTRTVVVGSGGGTSIARALDANGNNHLDDAEILRAIQFWIAGSPVPGTGGQVIDDEKILRLIQLWIGGAPL